MLTTQLTEELALAYLDKSPGERTILMLLLNLSPDAADVSSVTAADVSTVTSADWSWHSSPWMWCARRGNCKRVLTDWSSPVYSWTLSVVTETWLTAGVQWLPINSSVCLMPRHYQEQISISLQAFIIPVHIPILNYFRRTLRCHVFAICTSERHCNFQKTCFQKLLEHIEYLGRKYLLSIHSLKELSATQL